MKSIYNVGIIHLLESDGMAFVVFNNSINRLDLDIIGCYRDKQGVIKRIRRDSVWGKKIIELLTEPPLLELSESQRRLRELIDKIGIGYPVCVK